MKLALTVSNLKSDFIAIDQLELSYELSDNELDSVLRAYPEIIAAVMDAIEQ